MHFFTQSLSQKQEKQVCSRHITELEFANGRSEHVLSNEQCTNWLSTNRPSFAAANQIMALMHGEPWTCWKTESTCCRSVQFRCCNQIKSWRMLIKGRMPTISWLLTVLFKISSDISFLFHVGLQTRYLMLSALQLHTQVHWAHTHDICSTYSAL